MVSEIGIGIYAKDKNPVVEFRHVKVTNVGEPYCGVSKKTGEEFKIVKINLELSLGENVKRNYIMVTAFTQGVEILVKRDIKKGDIVTVQVDFNIGGNFPTTEVRLLDVIKEQQS